MKKTIRQQIYEHRYFLLFILLFAYLHSIQSRLLAGRTLSILLFTPEAAVADFLSVLIMYTIMKFLMVRFQHSSSVFSAGGMLKLLIATIVVYLAIIQLISFLIALGFGNIERNFNQVTILRTIMNDVLEVFIYGGFFLAYTFYQQNKEKAVRLLSYNQSLAAGKIAQLKAQLNPHFLFNNLNVLDQLIEEDQKTASDFLNQFADLYRYTLETSNKKIVSLEEELNFVEIYFQLMKQRYPDAYQLEIIKISNLKQFIPPLTLQLLVENAIEHNAGNKPHPVRISISIAEKITVTNTLQPKPVKKTTGGRSLKNLIQQYQLLSKQSIKIDSTDSEFIVSLPIILTPSA